MYETIIKLLPLSVINGFVRHILTFLAGYLLSAGLIDASSADQIISALMTLFAVVWSALGKYGEATPPAVTPILTKDEPKSDDPIAKL